MGAINKFFANNVYESAKKCKMSPLFITAITCLESDWGRRGVLEYNLFGERAGEDWKGRKQLVRTTEIHHSEPVLLEKERIVSRYQLNKGTFKFIIMRWYKDYDSIYHCISDHIRIFNQFPEAMKHCDDAHLFPKLICKEPFTDSEGIVRYKKYDSLEDYPLIIESMYKTLLKLGIK